GIPADDALALDGSRGERILRGAIAATRVRIHPLARAQLCVRLSADLGHATLATTMAQLVILRAAFGSDHSPRSLSIAPAPATKMHPRLKRLSEHLAITQADWLEQDADLSALFSWFDPAWTDNVTAAVNKHGSLIPGF